MPDTTKKKYTRENCPEPLDAFLAIANEISELNDTLTNALFVDGDGDRSLARNVEEVFSMLENDQGESRLKDIAEALGASSSADD